MAVEAAGRKTFRFRVANFTSQVDAVAIVRRDVVAILGRANANTSVVTIVALPSGRDIDSFVCFRPVTSPSLRYIAYVKWFPAHIGYGYTVTFEYVAYDLASSPPANRPNGASPSDVYDVGWPVYPFGARNRVGDTVLEGNDLPAHFLASDGFFWLGADSVAFVDRWHDANSLVVADLSAGVQHPRVTVRPIETSRLVDFASCEGKAAPSDLERWRKAPGSLIFVNDIQNLSAKPGWVRLTLAPQACLLKTTLDMHIASR